MGNLGTKPTWGSRAEWGILVASTKLWASQMDLCLLCCVTWLFLFSISQFSFCVLCCAIRRVITKAERDSWKLMFCLVTVLYLPFLMFHNLHKTLGTRRMLLTSYQWMGLPWGWETALFVGTHSSTHRSSLWKSLAVARDEDKDLLREDKASVTWHPNHSALPNSHSGGWLWVTQLCEHEARESQSRMWEVKGGCGSVK